MANRLPTRAEWDAAIPFRQGYLSYLYSAWPKSEVPNEGQCPYKQGSKEYDLFQQGVRKAVQDAQDSEE